ncbi:MAG: hypothetical protein DI535_06855 [Citrobacter freundii]|nr:MAG: hypothetical protein DI535_06855 [Citrobacter freundii]
MNTIILQKTSISGFADHADNFPLAAGDLRDLRNQTSAFIACQIVSVIRVINLRDLREPRLVRYKAHPKNKTLHVSNSKTIMHISSNKNNPLFQVKTG